MRVGILLLLAVLVLGTGGALAAISISNTLTPSYGTVDYTITSDGTKSGSYTVTENQGASNTLVKIESVNVYGASSFTGDISAETNYGDYADTSVDFTGTGGDVKVDNFNMYAYLTPNLAWTGQYTGAVKAEYIEFDGYAYTRDDTSNSKGYQNSYLDDWDTHGYTCGDADFTASNVYTTDQAGGSYDPNEFDVGQSDYAKSWGGQGTYAMSNVEYGSFSIGSTTRASSEYWELGDPYSTSTDFNDNYIEADSSWNGYFQYGPLTFSINTPAMNYADADIAYSNTDFGVKGFAGSQYDNEDSGDYGAYAESYYYFPHTTQDNIKTDVQEDVPLPGINNIFAYGYVNVPQNIVKSDIIYY
jgi:hypothetical protein